MPTAPRMANSAKPVEATLIEGQTLEIVRGLLTELGSRRAARDLSLHSFFERDLGLGSLERVELLVRLERRFKKRLPDDIAQQAETPAEWVRALQDGIQIESPQPRYRIEQPSRAAPPAPEAAGHWVEVLRHHAEVDPGRVHIHLLDDIDLGAGQAITYGRLFENASGVAAGLVAAGLQPNDTVAIMLPTCAGFFYAFFGVMLAGGIAVPIYPPARPDKIEEYVRRQVQILRNAQVRFLIIFDRVKAVSQIMRASIPSLVAVSTVDTLQQAGSRLPTAMLSPSDPFFIQYTSGSTGDPKGVVLTHANVLANVRGIGWAVKVRPTDYVVTWLPLYHDMGLIGSWLFSVHYGLPITVLSPLAFLSRPERWLWALHDSRGSLCPAPNFSYELCARKIPDDAIAGLDLSAWRVAINAGEAVLPETLARFAKRFEPYGFRPESYVPCYGLAESSVALAFPPIGRAPVVDTIRRDLFEREGKAVPVESADASDPSVLRFVANGKPLPDHEVRISDDDGREVGERVQGRLFFRGPSQTPGYFRNPEATAASVTPEGWMDSGDLAYWANGELCITGRSKDLIIKLGRNIIPQEVEAAASEVAGVRRGCVAVFGSMDAMTGTERLVVVAETRATSPTESRRIESEIIQKVDAAVGIPPDAVALVPPQTIPKTSSGKIRRTETRSLFERGALQASKRPPWVQLARLAKESLGPWAAAGRARGRAKLHATWVGSSVAAVGVAGGLLSRVVPNRKASARITLAAARCALRLNGQRVAVQGNLLAKDAPVVLVANREGGYDPLALAAALRSPFVIADRAALAALPRTLRFLLEPLVMAPSNGPSRPPSGTSRERIRTALERNYSVLVFPDGPAGATAQRSRFRLDAFYAAVETGRPIHPIAVGGTSWILKANGKSQLKGRNQQSGRSSEGDGAKVRIGEPIFADGTDDREIARLRQQVRDALAKLSG